MEETALFCAIEQVNAAWGCPIVTLQVVLYPNLSVTVTEWLPALKPTACCVVSPLSHKYV